MCDILRYIFEYSEIEPVMFSVLESGPLCPLQTFDISVIDVGYLY